MKQQPQHKTWFMIQQQEEVNKKPKQEISRNKRANEERKG